MPSFLIAQTQVQCQKQHNLHRETNQPHASIPFIVKEISRTCPLPTTMFHRKGKHKNKCISNNYISSGRKIACSSLPYTTSTSALPKTIIDHEENLTRASFLSITRTNTLPRNTFHHEGNLSQAQVHCQNQHCM
jgi:hypothetical protein